MSASSTHDAAHEALLHAAVTADDGTVPAALADCATCREALDELRSVSRLLDETAREERETLAGLDWGAAAPGVDGVAPFLRERFERRARRPLVRGRALVLRYAAAAAAVLTCGWLARELVTAEPETRVLLGEQGFLQVSPQGAVPDFGVFKWSFQENVDGWYVVQVLSDTHELIDVSGQLVEPRWEPPRDLLERLPREIVWTVTAYDASGARLESITTTASRP